MLDYNEKARKIHQEIHKVLLGEWDPIGVRDIPEANDEYDSYIPTIYKMLISDKTKNEIFDYLWWIETEHIGVSGDRQRTEQITKRLIDLYSKYGI